MPGRQPGPSVPKFVIYILISVGPLCDLVIERTAMLGKQRIHASRFRDSGWTLRLWYVAFLAGYSC